MTELGILKLVDMKLGMLLDLDLEMDHDHEYLNHEHLNRLSQLLKQLGNLLLQPLLALPMLQLMPMHQK